VNRPSLILADEPTGSLDSASMDEVLASFDEVVRRGTALLVATHDPRVAERMRRVIRMHDGRLESTTELAGPIVVPLRRGTDSVGS
jgi:lipoprotein-releasing system ATP-binding protein